MAKVTYRPGIHDPSTVVWNEIEFQANIPVELTDENTITIDMPVQHVTDDGLIRTITRRQKIPMVDAAKGNPFFRVEGEAAPKAPVMKSPINAEQYKLWATKWINEADDYDLLMERWENETKLRERCKAVGAVEGELNALFTQRAAVLKRAAGVEERRLRARAEANEVEAI